MPILNNGETPDRLVVAASPVAAQVRFRAAKDGETRWPEAIPLAPGKPFALAEWREHIWLTGLKRPLKPGDRFPLTLTFAKAGKLDIEVMVEESGGHCGYGSRDSPWRSSAFR